MFYGVVGEPLGSERYLPATIDATITTIRLASSFHAKRQKSQLRARETAMMTWPAGAGADAAWGSIDARACA
jgi:hypothetical protein